MKPPNLATTSLTFLNFSAFFIVICHYNMNTSTAGTQNRRITAPQLDTRREIWHGPTRCRSNKPSPTDQADARGWPSRQLRHGQTASSVDSSCLAQATGTGFRRRASRHVVCVCIGGLAWLQWHALLVPARRVANLARSVGSCALRGPPCYPSDTR